MPTPLIRRILSRDATAFEDLTREYTSFVSACIHKALRRYSFWPGREDVEDLQSAFFLSLMEDDFRKIRQFEGRSSFETYLNVIAIRQVVDFLRRQKHQVSLDDEEVDPGLFRDHGAGADRLLEMTEEERTVAEAIQLLPAQDRLLLKLVVFRGLTPRKVCKIMDISMVAYYNRKSRIFRKLKFLCEKAEPASSIWARR